MKSNPTIPAAKPANGLLANIDRSDPDQVLVAFRLLRARHRRRPDVKLKLAALAERRQAVRR